MSRWPTIFFAVNFAGAMLYMLSALVAIGPALGDDSNPRPWSARRA